MKLALYEEDRKVFTTDLETLGIFIEAVEDGNELDLIKYNDKIYAYYDQVAATAVEAEVQYKATKVYELV